MYFAKDKLYISWFSIFKDIQPGIVLQAFNLGTYDVEAAESLSREPLGLS